MYRSHFYPKWSINLIRVLPFDIYLLSYKIVNFPYFIVCGGSMTEYDSTTIGWIYFISFVLTCCCEVSASQQTAFHLYSSLFTKFYFILFNYLRDIFSIIYKYLTSWLFMLSHFIFSALLYMARPVGSSLNDLANGSYFIDSFFVPVLWLCSWT